MGQGHSTSTGAPAPEELALRLTNIFAEKCFSHFDLHCFKHTFKSLAEEQDGVKYWSEATFIKFLELPGDLEPGSAAALYRICSYLGAFPFPSHAPAVLTGEALLRIVCLMTGRYMKVMDSGKSAWIKEMWMACAISEPKALTAKIVDHPEEPNGGVPSGTKAETSTPETTQDEVGSDIDELAFHAFQLVHALEVYEQGEKVNLQQGSIPGESFLQLLQLLLLIAPLGSAEEISLYTTQLAPKRLEALHEVSSCIMASFGLGPNAGIGYETFEVVVVNTLPHLFDGFAPLFEHFLFPRKVTIDENKTAAPEESSTVSGPPSSAVVADVPILTPEPLLPVQGDILDLNLVSQLSFVFSDADIFHRLRPLYLGQNHGYSMGSFEQSVFKWSAPSFLLVSGTLISPHTKQSSARAFVDELPYRRLASSLKASLISEEDAAGQSIEDNQRIIYGAYIPGAWESSSKSTFGTDKTTMFQLSPVHDVFPATSSNQNYAYFTKAPALYSGLGFGSPLPAYSSMTASQQSSSTRRSSVTNYSARDTIYENPGSPLDRKSSFSGPSSPGLTRRSSLIGDEYVPLGPVSLHIDDSLEFGVFTHITSSGGSGSFQRSKLPVTARAGNGADWQDRFKIDAIEVWGVGDASVAEEQRKAWLWEAREAERRKAVNLVLGDKDADREFLKMAGLIKDEGRSGGSLD